MPFKHKQSISFKVANFNMGSECNEETFFMESFERIKPRAEIHQALLSYLFLLAEFITGKMSFKY